MILPKEILARLKVEKGDQIFLPEAPHVVAGHNTEQVFADWFEPHIALKDKH